MLREEQIKKLDARIANDKKHFYLNTEENQPRNSRMFICVPNQPNHQNFSIFSRPSSTSLCHIRGSAKINKPMDKLFLKVTNPTSETIATSEEESSKDTQSDTDSEASTNRKLSPSRRSLLSSTALAGSETERTPLPDPSQILQMQNSIAGRKQKIDRHIK
ncbi:hypothetical protein TSAR_006723 [Trichomalopsis sarcophagae]|uniref:Uncharacterized protein n=1 Tax=Trichomalopsis sarcophagae TaxID=543379 RepID=A0A232ENA2_9HYME|nr:hypothetical protein TSAR_006723 [Trichomalopsis sarcophagae]